MEIGFLASTWGLPPGLALADYWSHLLQVYPLGRGFTPLALLWVYPFDWAKPGVYPPDHPGFTPQMGSPPRFEAKG